MEIEDLRASFDMLHSKICSTYGKESDVKDFEESLHILEGGFISIRGLNIYFINPSLRDYLSSYLNDEKLLQDCALASNTTNFAYSVWKYGKKRLLNDEAILALAISFKGIAAKFSKLPTLKRDKRDGIVYISQTGLSNTSRIELLMEWWEVSKDELFSNLLLSLAESPVSGLDTWRDGNDAIELLGRISDGDYYPDFPDLENLKENFEKSCIEMIGQAPSPEEMDSIFDAFEQWKFYISDGFSEALENAITNEFENIDNIVANMDSESELSDYSKTLEKLANHASTSPTILAQSLNSIQNRVTEIEEEVHEEDSPSVIKDPKPKTDAFDDGDLINLFKTLLDKS